MWWHWSGIGWLLMILGMVGFWAAVAYLVVGLARRTEGPPASPDTPEQILARRLANGEIDEAEYRSRLGALHADDNAGVAAR